MNANHIPALQPHQQRVVEELNQLTERATKLDAFIKTSEAYLQLVLDEQIDLVAQHALMTQLEAVLRRRVGRFT